MFFPVFCYYEWHSSNIWAPVEVLCKPLNVVRTNEIT
jgi:hypothetical protein